MKKYVAGLAAGCLAAGFVLTSAGPAQATLDMQKKAKAAGIAEATNCMYCHNEKMPKKEAVTNNERGKWLVDQKEAKKAKEVDVTWLKDYTPPKK
jgi:cytochrome c-type biogenesis protein CcmH/NrfF